MQSVVDKKMKMLFFGSGKIALPSLEALIGGSYGVVGVITAPDSRKGRHLSFSQTPIKDYALRNKLKIYQPKDITLQQSIEYINSFDADLFIVFAYGKILPKALLEIPKRYALNIHASLLPKYRGAAPINWALINGELKTGVSIIKMEERIDEGKILAQKEFFIENSDNAMTLGEKLGKLGAGLLCETIERINENNVKFYLQNSQDASFAPKLKKSDGRIHWKASAQQIRDRVRGCIPWPGAFAFFRNKMIKIWECEIMNDNTQGKSSPGAIVSLRKEGLIVATGDKNLLIRALQLENAKRLDAWQFIQGYRLKDGDMFT